MTDYNDDFFENEITIDDLIKENEDLNSRIDQLIELIVAMKYDIREIYKSWSWRLTAPFRGVINLFTLGRFEGEIPEYLKEKNIFDALLVADGDKKNRDIDQEYRDKYEDSIAEILECFDPVPWDLSLRQRLSELDSDIEAGFQIVIHMYDTPDASTFRYACYNVSQYTKESRKIRAHFFYSNECKVIRGYLDKVKLLVFCRTKWRKEYNELLQAAKGKQIPVIMQIDDLVCSLDYMSYILDMNLDHKGSDYIYDSWFANVTRLESIAKKVDGFIVTNDYLGNQLKEIFRKDYAVIRNSLNKEQIGVSEKLVQNKIKRKKRKKDFVIGYFSGSPTHRRDLQVALDEIKRLLDTYSNIILMVVGYMEFPRVYQKYIRKGRIIFKPLVNFLELQYYISLADVNIVPLEDNVFTSCKSELKFFEAAIVNTITVATPTYTYSKCISDKEDGFLCKQGEWFQTISDIYEGKYDIEYMVSNAKEKALDRYSGTKVLEEIEKAYEIFL